MSDDIRLATIREICRREGHNPIDTTTVGDLPLERHICGRGCGAVIRQIRPGYSMTVDHAITVLSGHSGSKVPVTELRFVVEPEDAR